MGPFTVFNNHIPETNEMTLKPIEDYGLAGNLASIENLDVDIFYHLGNNVPPDFDEWTKKAMPGVKSGVEKGAKVILIGCGSALIAKFAPKLNEVTMNEYNVPVLTPLDTLIEVTRKLVKERG